MGNLISLKTVLSAHVNHSVSMAVVAQKLARKAPVSVRNLISILNGVPTTVVLQKQTWTTSDGSDLGGTVALTINSDGTYSIEFDTIIHSGVPGFSCSFQVRAYLAAPGLPHCLLFVHAGDIGGDLLKGQGEDDHKESGSNPVIAMYWNQIISATLQVQHDQQPSGIVGAVVHVVDSLVKDLINVGAAVIGTAIGAVVGVTREAIGWLGTSLGPGTTIGVIAGVAVFVIGAFGGLAAGQALVLGTVTGVAAGAIANSMIQTRPMSSAEIAVAEKVFRSELNYENVLFTNLAGQNGRAFTAPGVDGKTYCSLGRAYNNTLGPGDGAYPFAGEVMIHELTHAWQIAQNSFMPGFVCSGIVNQAAFSMGDNVYAYGPAGPEWSAFNLEQQGQIVNQWFAGNNDNDKGNPQSHYGAMDTAANPYYQYIKGNILTGAAGFSTNWL
jgi:hypothetical protein